MLPIGTASAILPIVAAVAGLGGNVAAGTITVITTPIPNIDTVTNAVALINGEDPESDTALRARFTAFIASRSKATLAAVNYAIQGQQQGLTQSINENMQLDGITDKGFFHAVVDDGSGEPSTDLLTSVYSAVDAVRPLTVSFAVFGPTTVNINIALKLTIVPGYGVTDVKTAVQAAIVNYVNGLGVGVSMQYSKIAQLAYTTSDGVANVANVLLNGGIIDVVAAPNQLFKTSSTLVVVS